MSRTSVVVTPGPRRSTPARVRVETGGPRGRAHLGVRLLGVRHQVVRIALVAEGALLLAGDEVDLRLRVGQGCRLEVVEPSGTVAYDMRGGSATWSVTIEADQGAEVVWAAQPFVVAGGADVVRRLTVDLAPGACVRMREVVVLGRSREIGGRVAQSTTVVQGGLPLHLEDLVLDGAQPRVGVLGVTGAPAGRGGLGGLGGLRVVDTVSVFGERAPGIPLPEGSHRLDLEAEATLVRSLAAEAHLASLDAVWSALRAAEQSRPGTATAQEDSHDVRPHDPVAELGQRSRAAGPSGGRVVRGDVAQRR